MPNTQTQKLTNKYCRTLMDDVEFPELLEGSDEIDADELKAILKKCDRNSRFIVGFDPNSYANNERDTWDVLGPGVFYGQIFYTSRDEAAKARDALNSILRRHFGPRDVSVDFTPEAYKARVILEGRNCCPACGSDNILTGDHHFKTAACTVHMACEGCGPEWKSVYSLHGYVDLRND